MTFPDSNILRGTISDLKEIVARSQGSNSESTRLLGLIEATVCEIEKKTGSALSAAVAVQQATPVSITL